MPVPSGWKAGQFESQHVCVHIEGSVEKLTRAAQRVVMLTAQHEGQRVAVFAPVGFTRFYAVPGDIGITAADVIETGKPIAPMQARVPMAESDKSLHKTQEPGICFRQVPIQPVP